MKKKIFIGSIVLILIGIIIVIATGFNVDIQYRAHKSIIVPIGENVNISDINAITNEVFGKGKAVVSKGGLYNDEIIIDIADVNDDQINNLKNKLNEKYNVSQKIYVTISDEYNIDDVKSVANEVFGKEDSIVNKSKDNAKYAEIEANIVTESDLENLNNKINEKFNLTNDIKSVNAENVIIKKDMPRVRLTDMAKQYILYTLIATIIVMIYFAIRYIKLGIVKVLGTSIAVVVISELLYMSIIAITRIAIDKIVIIAAFAIYILSLILLNKELEKKLEKQ